MKFDSWVPNFNFPYIPEEIRKYELTREVDLFNLDTLERKQTSFSSTSLIAVFHVR